MKYLWLLRGINVGGKHKVAMGDLRQALEDLGYSQVQSILNSGNLVFSSLEPAEEIDKALTGILATYPFPIEHVLMSQADFQVELTRLPSWWQDELARKDVLFLTSDLDLEQVKASIQSMTLGQERVHFGHRVIFWAKEDESSYLKTAYHKELLKQSYYPHITIRNGKTFDRLRLALEG